MPFVTIFAHCDAQGRLVEASEPVARLQAACGGTIPGTLAIPALAELLAQARVFGLKLARPVQAQDGTEQIRAWAEIEPHGEAGVTPNDPNDTDEGPNHLQNAPVLEDVRVAASSLLVAGSLDIGASETFRPYELRFYASPVCDDSGSGEGAVPIAGSVELLSHDAEGFEVLLPADIAPGTTITATVTRLESGDSSEFSACAVVGFACGDVNQSGSITAPDALTTLRTAVGTAQCDPCLCDINREGGVTTTDALLILKASVGQAVSLECSPCAA